MREGRGRETVPSPGDRPVGAIGEAVPRMDVVALTRQQAVDHPTRDISVVCVGVSLCGRQSSRCHPGVWSVETTGREPTTPCLQRPHRPRVTPVVDNLVVDLWAATDRRINHAVDGSTPRAPQTVPQVAGLSSLEAGPNRRRAGSETRNVGMGLAPIAPPRPPSEHRMSA